MSKIWRNFTLTLSLILLLGLTGCPSGDRGQPHQPQTLQTYRNAKYGFAFPYPESWVASLPTEKADGSIFANPQDPAIEVRGWASVSPPAPAPVAPKPGPSNQLPPSVQPVVTPKTNFKTLQGVAGTLQVQITPQLSSLDLTIIQGKTRYYWRGSAPSDRFANYYAFFYYVVLRYQIPL